MATILINGDFFCRRLTGIERYAFEITNRLDSISSPGEIAIIVPANAEIPAFTNITVIRHRKKIKSHFIWQMITLQWYVITHRQYIPLEFGNTALPFAPGIVFLHDIYCEFYPEDFITFRDKLIRLYNKMQYRLIANHAKAIATVSNFSKNQITHTYHIDPKRITVIYSSWNHFQTIEADYGIFTGFPQLQNTPYYFSLGSLSKRKNIQWIVDYARRHTGILFVISGESLSTLKALDQKRTSGSDSAAGQSMPENILFCGYLDDTHVKALMTRCKAFLLPSYYEGFGLTPLEALSCGAQIIVANSASLPEIYGNCAHYIDPLNTDINLDAVLTEKVADPNLLLEKYSYDTSARRVYDLIKKTAGPDTVK